MSAERQTRTRWIIGSLISLLAAGGGIAAIVTLVLPKDGNVVPVTPPAIVSFLSTPAQVAAGGSATLLWQVSGASSVVIEPGLGEVALEGSRDVSPTATTTYTLNATNEAGAITANWTIEVAPPGNLHVRATTSAPSVGVGEKAAIYITVTEDNHDVVPGVTVLLESGGGKFLASENESYDPSSRLHGPYSTTGLTDSAGVFTAWWACNPCAGGYVMSVKASKEGYNDAVGEVTVNLH